MSIQIAIDGPAGSGKSTVAKALAKRRGFLYVDTGAMYRSVTKAALDAGIPAEEGPALQACLDQLVLRFEPSAAGQKVFLNGEEVTEAIRSVAVSQAVSRYAALPMVRQHLFDFQRDLAEKDNVIMDGRDIGTVILPNAQYKFFLTASAEERAKRRTKEMQEKGLAVAFADVLKDIKERDIVDENRKEAPLRQAEDAILIDTDGLKIDEVIGKLESYLI